MALLNEIKSPYWQPSIGGSGMVVEGVEDIRQCLDVLLRTQKGTDALRPEFGSDIYKYIDGPVNAVIPAVKRAIIEAIQIFETRVSVVGITHKIIESNIQFFITYKLLDDDQVDQLQLYASRSGFGVSGNIPIRLILEAIIPADYAGFIMVVEFVVDGSQVLPLPPEFGFPSPDALYTWVLANWGSYGTWYLLRDKLVLYMSRGATSATLSITVIRLYRYASTIPSLLVSENYGLTFTQEDSAINEHNTTSSVLADLLAFANEHYAIYGEWRLESRDGVGDYDAFDFDNNDFNTRSFYQLVLYSNEPGLSIEVTVD